MNKDETIISPKKLFSSKEDVNMTVNVDDILEGENATIAMLMPADGLVSKAQESQHLHGG